MYIYVNVCDHKLSVAGVSNIIIMVLFRRGPKRFPSLKIHTQIIVYFPQSSLIFVVYLNSEIITRYSIGHTNVRI